MPALFPQVFYLSELAPLILRLVLGAVFIAHGYPKLFKDFYGTAAFFESVGLKPAKFWVLVVGSVEFFGGILLILGLFTQAVALLIVINMLGAIWKVKFKQGFVNGYEFDLALLAMAATLFFLGAGAYSIDFPF